jgi:hypothetical protein
VEITGRISRGGEIPWLAELAVTPGTGLLEFPDRAVQNEFPDPVEVLVLVALGADLVILSGSEEIGPHHPRFFNAARQRFRKRGPGSSPNGDERMYVVAVSRSPH